MAKKADVKIGSLGDWKKYANAPVETAPGEFYRHAESASAAARQWYWDSIRSKRMASQAVRSAAFVLLVLGALLPIVSGFNDDPSWRLRCTQAGVVFLAFAGLVQAADKIFGWSSGWLRYMTTVTTMETITRKFELDWANYMISRPGSLTEDDKRPLFELAKQLEDAISKLQTEETDKWVADFNSSLALLNDLIKTQRESAEKTVEAARSAVAAKESAAAVREKSEQPGGIEVSILHKADPIPVDVSVDSDAAQTFTGRVWVKLQVTPGQHIVRVTSPAFGTVQKIAEVPPAGVARVEVKLS
jgi:hypothetical protein